MLRNQRLADLEEQRTDPQALTFTRLRGTLSPYPPDDVRYIATIDEEIVRTKALTRDHVKKLYDEYVGARAGELAVVGDFDAAAVTAFAEALAGWKARQPYARLPRVLHANVPGSSQRIETPDKANAMYGAGIVFPVRDDDPDYPAIVMGNYILGGGGGLSSRLGDRIRQKEGLSYGVGSMAMADAFDPWAMLLIYAIANPPNIPKVETAVMEELDRLLEKGVTSDELAKSSRATSSNCKWRGPTTPNWPARSPRQPTPAARWSTTPIWSGRSPGSRPARCSPR